MIKLDVEGDRLTLTGALLVFDSRRSGFRSVAIPMDGIKVNQLRPRRSSGFVFEKILSKKLYFSISTCGRRRMKKNKRDKIIRTVVKVLKKNHLHNTMEENIPDGSKIPHVLSTGMKSVSPG